MKVGLFNSNRSIKSGAKNKWSLLSYSFKNVLSKLMFLFLICLIIGFFKLKVYAKFVKNILRSVLFITICYYYFKSCEFLFICLDIEMNPGYTDGFFRFCCWNTNSLNSHQLQRVASLQAYSTLNDLNLICVTESALKKKILTIKLKSQGTSLLGMT